MLINSKKYIICALLSSSLYANNIVVDELLTEYRAEGGATEFSAEIGKKFWSQEFTKGDKVRQCSNCHTEDLRNEGKHIHTGKIIKPLAPSANPERLTNLKKVRKWLKRNCKWTLGRECNAQEKGDILKFIQTYGE